MNKLLKQSYYFLEFNEESECYTVLFGVDNPDDVPFAEYIADFVDEDDAREYINWKNEDLSLDYDEKDDSNDTTEDVLDLTEDQILDDVNDHEWTR